MHTLSPPIASTSTSLLGTTIKPAVPHPAQTINSKSCSVCAAEPKYTCPGCSARTCSAACSKAHKARTGCTGTRSKAHYVPLNTYGYGQLMDDYVYLEDMRNRVSDWGRQVSKLPSSNAPHSRGPSGRPARGRGGKVGTGAGIGHGRKNDNGNAARRYALKCHLEAQYDITMELLPPGMERAAKNQSGWARSKGKEKERSNAPLLTIEYVFKDRTSPSSQSILTHRNPLTTSLSSILESHASKIPDWALETEYCSFALGNTSVSPYVPISEALKGTAFVEFPAIKVETTRPPEKRRRVDKEAMKNVLGGYGSDSEAESEHQSVTTNGLALLGDYEDEEDSDEEEDGVSKQGLS